MNDWVSVKKKKPPVDEIVLAIGTIGEKQTYPGVVKYKGRGVYYSADGILGKATAKVTHWMPLPAPPEKEEEIL